MRVVLAFPVVGLLVGAALGLQWPDLPPALLVAILCGWLVLAVHAHRVSNRAWLAACTVGVFTIGGVALSANAWHRAWRPTIRLAFEAAAHDARLEATRAGRLVPEDDAVPMVLVGVLRSDGTVGASGGVSLSLDVEWAGRVADRGARDDPATNPVEGGVLITVLGSLAREHAGAWRAGRRVRATADLHRVARYLDPGVPDQERILARRGISLVGTVKSAALVDVLGAGSPLDELAAHVRAYTRRAIVDGVGPWSPRAAGIVTAIVIGDRTGLDDDVERRLQESGTYHVIAISGGNIAILAGLTLAMFRFAGVLGRAAMLTSAAGLVAYGFVVGGGASVDRAVLMAVVYFVGRAWDLRGPPFQALVLAAGILVLKDPLSVADPASLLTFGATAAIVATAPFVAKVGGPAAVAPALSLLVASASTEVLLLPVSAALFSRVTFAGLALNFGAIPLMAVAQLAGMAVVPLHAVSPLAARAVGWLAFVGAEGLVRTASLVSVAPWSTWRVPPPSPATIAVYYLTVIGSWLLWRRDLVAGAAGSTPVARAKRGGVTLLAALAGVWVVAAPSAPWSGAGDGLMHVTFIDVGQGDAALVRFPRGASMLIDAGGLGGASSFDIGDRIVAPVLRQAGVRRLGTLALTHGDADHIGGARSVVGEFRPWDIWDGVPVPPFEPMARLRADAHATGARWTTVQRTDLAVQDDVRIVVRHPTAPDWERQDVRNDDSIVLELIWRDVSFVFTGDIGRGPEADIAPLFAASPLRVVKVPHHGSTTSSSDFFVRALAPKVAVVSVGRSNNFGHPSPVVLKRYAAGGAAIFRTDQDGAVTIDTDGTSLSVHTFTGRTLRLSSATKTRRHEESSEQIEMRH